MIRVSTQKGGNIFESMQKDYGDADFGLPGYKYDPRCSGCGVGR